MEELVNKLNAIPNSYFGFVAGIITYVKHDSKRVEKVLKFINESEAIAPSDVVKFVIDQPDFFNFDKDLKENNNRLKAV